MGSLCTSNLTTNRNGFKLARMQMNRNGYDDLDAEVSAEVRALIARNLNASVKAIAEKRGIRRATLSARVNGHVAFTSSELAVVAAELGTTASEIVARAEKVIADRGSRRRRSAA